MRARSLLCLSLAIVAILACGGDAEAKRLARAALLSVDDLGQDWEVRSTVLIDAEPSKRGFFAICTTNPSPGALMYNSRRQNTSFSQANFVLDPEDVGDCLTKVSAQLAAQGRVPYQSVPPPCPASTAILLEGGEPTDLSRSIVLIPVDQGVVAYLNLTVIPSVQTGREIIAKACKKFASLGATR